MKFITTVLALFCSLSLWAQDVVSPDLPGALRLQIGTNNLKDAPTNMDLGFWGSKSFNAYYLYSVALGDSRWSLHPGFGIGTDKYSFDNDITLARNADGTVGLQTLDVLEFGKVEKTKLATTHFEIPVELRFHVNKDDFKKSIKVAVGGKIGLLLSSHTKVNFELDGENNKLKAKDNFELNRLRYGVQGSIGIAGVSVYFYYGLNELFESGRGPEATQANQTQLGFAFNAF